MVKLNILILPLVLVLGRSTSHDTDNPQSTQPLNSTLVDYTVTTRTYFGTRDRIQMFLIGSKGNTTPVTLDNPGQYEFIRGTIDVFKFRNKDIGILKGFNVRKYGYDRVYWDRVEIKTSTWSEAFYPTYNQMPDIRNYNYNFYVQDYRGCQEDAFWHHHLGQSQCLPCPAIQTTRTCSFPGSIGHQACSTQVCYIREMSRRFARLEEIVAEWDTDTKQDLANISTRLSELESAVEETSSSLLLKIEGVSGRVGDNTDLIRVVKSELVADVASLDSRLNEQVAVIAGSVGENKDKMKNLDSKVSQLVINNGLVIGQIEKLNETVITVEKKMDGFKETMIQEVGSLDKAVGDIRLDANTNKDNIAGVWRELEQFQNSTNGVLANVEQTLAEIKEIIVLNDYKIAENKKSVQNAETRLLTKINVAEEECHTKITEMSSHVEYNSLRLDKTGRFIYRSGDLGQSTQLQSNLGESYQIINNLLPADKFQFSGILTEEPALFAVAFRANSGANGKSNIALQVSFRYQIDTSDDTSAPISRVTFNSAKDGMWDQGSEYPWSENMVPGKEFTITIWIANVGYYVSVGDGDVSFPVYEHTHPLGAVTGVSVYGKGVWTKATMTRLDAYTKNKAWGKN